MAGFVSRFKQLAHGALNWDTQLDADLDDLQNILSGLTWSPDVTNYAVVDRKNVAAARIGNLIVGTAFLRLNGNIADLINLRLPLPASTLPNTYTTVGEIEYSAGGGLYRGRLVARQDQPTLAKARVDFTSPTSNNQIIDGPVDSANNAPFSGSINDFFVGIRLMYASTV